MPRHRLVPPLLLALAPACGEAPPCDATRLPSRARIECLAQFQAQAARPPDRSLPGAYTVKTTIDQQDGDRVHLQDSGTYPLHRSFALAHLGYPAAAPFVSEYFLPDRRLLLGAITRYEQPDLWAYELAPYDTASPEQVARAFRLLRDATFFGQELRFHVTSREQEALLPRLPADVPAITTAEIYRGLRYQALSTGVTIGRIRRLAAAELSAAFLGPQEIAVLDRAPPDLPLVAAAVTEEFQTPLSHVNVLSQQRGTLNMALRDARAALAEHEGRWVRLTVGAFHYAVEPVTQAEADAFWQSRRPPPAQVPAPDYERADLVDVDDLRLADLPAVGGKAAHFGELRRLARAGALRVRDGFAIPVRYYRQHLQQSGLDQDLAALLAQPRFREDGLYRRQQLAALQARIRAAPLDPELLRRVLERLGHEFPGLRMRFRSSTNAEDLRGHSGAGLYDSESGQPGDAQRPVDRAIKKVWASLWSPRAFQERDWAGIDHGAVAMGVLVQPTYTDEQANGVAVTANPFDAGPGGEDAFYINAQVGEESVVSPEPGVVADQILYFYYHPGQPATYYARSTQAPAAPVLSRAELFDLGGQLDAIRRHFAPLHPRRDGAPLAMEVEWKLVQAGAARLIEIKQARPYPERAEER